MEFIEQFKAARRVSTPIVCVRTFDPKSTTRAIIESLNGKKETTPLLVWDAIHGLLPVNATKASTVAHGHTLTQSDLQQEQTRNFAPTLGALELQPIEDTIIFVANAHLQWANQDPNVIQGIWNLRDVFKSRAVMLVLLTTPGATLPAELTNDVLTLDEPLPSAAQLEKIVADTFKSAQAESSLTDEIKAKAIEALVGIPAFAADQATAMSLSIQQGTKGGTTSATLSIKDLWSRKRQQINDTPGLNVYEGTETLKDIGGIAAAKSFMSAVMTGRRAPSTIIWYDEIEKGFAGHGTDMSGTKTELLGSQLTWHQERNIIGVLFLGIPGVSKSLLAKGLGNEFGKPTIGFDIASMQSGLVGSSNSNLRTAQKTVDAVSGGGTILAIATCNSVASLPVELLRRFGLATFFFEQPDATEREIIWQIHRAKLGIAADEPNPADEGWTGDDIRNCCEKAWMLNWTLAQAAEYIVPITKSDSKRIQTIRAEANNRYLSASKGGIYTMNEAGIATSAARQHISAPVYADEGRKIRG